jgi:hypothetical protein
MPLPMIWARRHVIVLLEIKRSVGSCNLGDNRSFALAE